jgi:transposase
VRGDRFNGREHKLREALEKENETISDQRKKSTKKTTMRRVFQVFEGTVLRNIGWSQDFVFITPRILIITAR